MVALRYAGPTPSKGICASSIWRDVSNDIYMPTCDAHVGFYSFATLTLTLILYLTLTPTCTIPVVLQLFPLLYSAFYPSAIFRIPHFTRAHYPWNTMALGRPWIYNLAGMWEPERWVTGKSQRNSCGIRHIVWSVVYIQYNQSDSAQTMNHSRRHCFSGSHA